MMLLIDPPQKHPTVEAEGIFEKLLNLSRSTKNKNNSAGKTANAIMNQKFFGHNRYKSIDDRKLALEKILHLIAKPEPRVYQFAIPYNGLFSKKGTTTGGHAFVVVQYTPKNSNEPYFKVIQSFKDTWSLQDNLEKK